MPFKIKKNKTEKQKKPSKKKSSTPVVPKPEWMDPQEYDRRIGTGEPIV
jgi:hypothetical protein